MYLYYTYFGKLYLYKPYSSNPCSGEFYIIGKDFLGIDERELDILLSVQDNFEENQVFVREEDISQEFISQIRNFLSHLAEYNIATIERRFFLRRCINDENDILGFKQLIGEGINKIREQRFKMWIDMFNMS